MDTAFCGDEQHKSTVYPGHFHKYRITTSDTNTTHHSINNMKHKASDLK